MQRRLGDDRQPRVEATLAGEARHGGEGPGERFLRDLFGLVHVADTAEAEAKQAR